jgi:UDP-N-acetylmuramate dehydrogenase
MKIEDINTSNFSLDDLIIWNLGSDKVKVGAARLIQLIKDDLDDFKNVSIYPKHALILISDGEASQKDILNYANNIKKVIKETFNISLDIEPTVIK